MGIGIETVMVLGTVMALLIVIARCGGLGCRTWASDFKVHRT